MGCFVAPMMEAVIVSIVEKGLKAKEAKYKLNNPEALECHETARIPFSRKLGWLSKMLWGGSALLIFEHVWHGEVVPYYPFLTGMASPEDMSALMHEISTAGLGMVIAVTAVWAGVVAVVSYMEKHNSAKLLTAESLNGGTVN